MPPLCRRHVFSSSGISEPITSQRTLRKMGSLSTSMFRFTKRSAGARRPYREHKGRERQKEIRTAQPDKEEAERREQSKTR